MIQRHLQLCLEKLKGVQQAKAKNRIGLPSEKHVCKMGTKNFFLSLRVSWPFNYLKQKKAFFQIPKVEADRELIWYRHIPCELGYCSVRGCRTASLRWSWPNGHSVVQQHTIRLFSFYQSSLQYLFNIELQIANSFNLCISRKYLYFSLHLWKIFLLGLELHSVLKSRDITLRTQVHIVKAMVFLVVMYGCESWTIKKAEHWRTDAFELWCWRRFLRISWTARRSNQSILKEINPEYSLEGLMLKLKLQYFGHLMWRADLLEGADAFPDLDAGKDWREKKAMAEDEMVR